MSKIIITGGTVLTINDADDVHFGGHVVLDGDRIAAVGEGPYTGTPGERRPGHRRVGQDRHARPGRPALPHGHRQGLQRSPAAVGVPGRLLVPVHPHPGRRRGLLVRGRQLPRVDQVRGDDGQRHVPPAARPGPGRGRHRHPGRAVQRCGAARAQPGHPAGQPGRLRRGARPRRRPDRGVRRHRVAAAGLPRAAPRRPGPGRRAGHRHPHPPERVADRGGKQQGTVRPPGPPRWPTTPGCSARTAWPRTACGCPTPRSR